MTEESSSKKKKKKSENFNSTIDELLEFSNQNPGAKNCILVGDLNARTGDKNTLLQSHEQEEFISTSSHPTEGSRTSKDTTLFKRGKLFLDILACANLKNLNGNTVGDPLGNFTCHNYKGCASALY